MNAQSRELVLSEFCGKSRVSPEEEAAAGFAFVASVSYGKNLDAGAGEAFFVKAEFFCGSGGYIKMTAGDERAAVVEAEPECFAVLEVCNLH
jgi:hypothetical protein